MQLEKPSPPGEKSPEQGRSYNRAGSKPEAARWRMGR